MKRRPPDGMGEMLQDIYDHEINIRLEWFWDAGIVAAIGDEANGWKDSATFDSVEEAIEWLWDNTIGKLDDE